MKTAHHLTLQIRDLLRKLSLTGFGHLMKNTPAELLSAFLLVYILQHTHLYVYISFYATVLT